MKSEEKPYPPNTVVRLKKTGEFAIITELCYLKGWQFLNYLGTIEGRGEGNWALYHDDLELECLPMTNSK